MTCMCCATSMPREYRQEDVPAQVKAELLELDQQQQARQQDPKKLTEKQRIERIEKILGID